MNIRQVLLGTALMVPAGSPVHAATREVGLSQTYTTIQACVAAAASGDVCNIHAGTYAEIVTIGVPGLTLRNSVGESPILKGGFDVGSTPNVTITCNSAGGVMEITAFGSVSVGASGVYQNGGSGLTLTGCRIHDGFGGGVYSRNSTRLRIASNEIYNLSSGGGNDGSGIITISGHSADGTYSGGVLITNNNVHDNHVDGMQLHGQYHTVSSNTIHDNLYSDWADTHPDGIQLNAGSADGYTSMQHAKILDNVIKNHTQNLFVSGSALDCIDIWIWNNVLYMDSGTLHGVQLDTLGVNNLVIAGANTVHVYNNTFGRSGSNSVLVQRTTDGSITIENNIFANNLGTGVDIESPASIASAGLDYNQYNTAGSAVVWGGTFYTNRSSFHSSVSTQETHGQDGSALLNPFPTPTLQSGSPCLSKGLNVSAILPDATLDIVGAVRGSVWDIGAYRGFSVPPLRPSGLRIVQ